MNIKEDLQELVKLACNKCKDYKGMDYKSNHFYKDGIEYSIHVNNKRCILHKYNPKREDGSYPVFYTIRDIEGKDTEGNNEEMMLYALNKFYKED